MAILREPTADHEREFDDEILELSARPELDPSELRLAFASVGVSWARFSKTAGLIFRQARLIIVLGFETDPRRRYLLTRRLKQVVLELERMK